MSLVKKVVRVRKITTIVLKISEIQHFQKKLSKQYSYSLRYCNFKIVQFLKK